MDKNLVAMTSCSHIRVAPQDIVGQTGRTGECLRVVVVVTAAILILAESCAAWEPRKEAKSPNEIVQMLRTRGLKVKEVPPADRSVESLAGHYTHGPGLSGKECYLFSDASYIYTEWADVLPETIFEKGTWSVKDGFIILKPDGSLPRDLFPKDHVYAPLLLNEAADVFLMSHRWDFSYFLEHAHKRSPDAVMFRICTLRRASQLSKAAQEEKRRELMARAWNPNFFKKEDGKESRH